MKGDVHNGLAVISNSNYPQEEIIAYQKLSMVFQKDKLGFREGYGKEMMECLYKTFICH